MIHYCRLEKSKLKAVVLITNRFPVQSSELLDATSGFPTCLVQLVDLHQISALHMELTYTCDY
jgi:hypothetical protein